MIYIHTNETWSDYEHGNHATTLNSPGQGTHSSFMTTRMHISRLKWHKLLKITEYSCAVYEKILTWNSCISQTAGLREAALEMGYSKHIWSWTELGQCLSVVLKHSDSVCLSVSLHGSETLEPKLCPNSIINTKFMQSIILMIVLCGKSSEPEVGGL